MKSYYTFLILTAIFLMLPVEVHAQQTVKKVYKIDLQKEIGASTWLYTQKGFAEAARQQADVILIHMNTYGGELVHADSIRTKILESSLPTCVFIDHNAASAGALIAIACDKIYMRQGATIGAATVVDQTGDKVPDKYQSFMRATMRATAEAHGHDTIVSGEDTVYRWRRDPLIAEAMVGGQPHNNYLSDPEKVLTLSAKEALEHGYCDGMAESVEEVIEQHLGYDNYELSAYRPTTRDELKGFFLSSAVRGILIMLIVAGLYFELQSPGIGLAGIVSLTAAALYFVPLYIDGLAANWEIILFFAGIALLALEIFVIPGFGIAGISGIVLALAALVLSMVGNDWFDFRPIETAGVGRALLTVTCGVAAGIGIALWLATKIGTKGALRKLALETTLDKQEGYVGVSMEGQTLVGQRGIAHTALRPAGKVNIAGRVHDALSEQSFIEKGREVIVTRYQGGQLYVEAVN